MRGRRTGLFVEGLGAVQRPKRFAISIDRFFRPQVFGCLCFLPLWIGVLLPVRAGGLADDFNLTGAEFGIYAHGSVREIAECKVDRVFTDHRRFGFFHVQLLPVLVVQGVRLELADQTADHGWEEGFKSDWLPEVKHDGVEWRDVLVTVKTEGARSIHADRAVSAVKEPAVVCRLENVTVKAGGNTWRTAHAELRDENGRPRVVWRAGADEFHWDLFTGEMTDPSTQNTAQK